MSHYNFGSSESIPMRLAPVDLPQVRGVNAGTIFGRPAPLKFVRAKKRPKFGAIFDNFRL